MPSDIRTASKFRPPRSPAGSVGRPHLVDRLGSPTSTLLLIAAPAGWGKSTLIAEWLAKSRDDTVAFAALDQLDDDPTSFWTTVIDALTNSGLDFGIRVPDSPQAGGSPIWPAVVPPLIDQLTEMDDPAMIVLDDYHVISDPRIHEGMRYLIDHVPDEHRLVIATRVEPPLRVARMRASGWLTEIRSADLAFDDDEVDAVVRSVAGIALPAPDVNRLRVYAEGWPAAIHLAALSLRTAEPADGFLEGFDGTQRHIADYLSTEVMDDLDPRMRGFLTRCSILDRLTPGLCKTVSGDEDAARLLDDAEEAGLFVISLDVARSTFRIHRLFRDWLRHRLAADAPDELPELHRRACEWYLGHGMPEEAIGHSLEAGDWDRARSLIRDVAAAAADNGHAALLARWLSRLPPDELMSDPVLAVAGASTAATAGDLERARSLTEAARNAIVEGHEPDADISLEAEILVVETLLELLQRNLLTATHLGRQAAEAEQDPNSHRFGIGHTMWATALFWSGRPAEARDAIQRVLDAIHTPFVQLMAWGMLAASCLEVGEVERAERVARQARTEAERRQSGPAPELAMSHLALGGALTDLGDPAEASQALEVGIRLSEVWNAPPQAAYGRLLLARLRAVEGDVAAARSLIDQAAPIVETARVRGTLQAALRRARAAVRTSPRRAPASTPIELTRREHDILGLLESRLSQRDIGATLGISRNTVKSYTQTLYRKLGVSSREEAVEHGRRLRLI